MFNPFLFLHDLKVALRSLARSKVLTVTVVIGMSTWEEEAKRAKKSKEGKKVDDGTPQALLPFLLPLPKN